MRKYAGIRSLLFLSSFKKPYFALVQNKKMKNILILSIGNTCRSQMAEGYLKDFCGEKAAVYSAGFDPQGIDARAKATMQEDDVDMDSHQSNHYLEYDEIEFDFVVTTSNRAQKVLPKFSKKTVFAHQNFKDITNTKGVPQAIANTYKTTRDEIKGFCRSFYIKHLLSD